MYSVAKPVCLSLSCFNSVFLVVSSPNLSKGFFHFPSLRKYVPELKDFPSDYIYEPWKAPLETQRTANCVVGDDYPQPIINHQEARRDCIQKLRGVYQNLVSKGMFCICFM